jgi:hypothetical protein
MIRETRSRSSDRASFRFAQLLRKWQRDPGLLNAVWHIGQRSDGVPNGT